MGSSLQAGADGFSDWSAACVDQFGAVGVTPLTASFQGSLRLQALGGLNLCEIASTPIQVSHKGLRSRGDHDALWVGLLRAGTASLTRGAAEVAWKAGDIIIYNNDEDYSCILHDKSKVLFVEVPISLARTGLLGDLSGPLQHRCGRDGTAAIAADLLRSTAAHASKLKGEEAARAANTLLTALGSAFWPEGWHRSIALCDRQTLRLRLHAYIERNLCAEDLTVASIAAAHGISHRYLNKLFEMERITAVGFIRKRRLERCRSMLLNSDNHLYSITEIAFSCGFRSSSSFNHAYRKEFGATPGEDRRLAYEAQDAIGHEGYSKVRA